jgi:hypothetical protein
MSRGRALVLLLLALALAGCGVGPREEWYFLLITPGGRHD